MKKILQTIHSDYKKAVKNISNLSIKQREEYLVKRTMQYGICTYTRNKFSVKEELFISKMLEDNGFTQNWLDYVYATPMSLRYYKTTTIKALNKRISILKQLIKLL